MYSPNRLISLSRSSSLSASLGEAIAIAMYATISNAMAIAMLASIGPW